MQHLFLLQQVTQLSNLRQHNCNQKGNESATMTRMFTTIPSSSNRETSLQHFWIKVNYNKKKTTQAVKKTIPTLIMEKEPLWYRVP